MRFKSLVLLTLLVSAAALAKAGWTLFAPAGYGFSISVPYKVGPKQPLPGGSMWVAAEPKTAMFIVGVANVTMTDANRQAAMKANVSSLLKSAQITETKRRTFKYKGMDAIEVEGQKTLQGSTYPATCRVLANNKRLYDLAVLRFRKDAPPAAQFLDSLKF